MTILVTAGCGIGGDSIGSIQLPLNPRGSTAALLLTRSRRTVYFFEGFPVLDLIHVFAGPTGWQHETLPLGSASFLFVAPSGREYLMPWAPQGGALALRTRLASAWQSVDLLAAMPAEQYSALQHRGTGAVPWAWTGSDNLFRVLADPWLLEFDETGLRGSFRVSHPCGPGTGFFNCFVAPTADRAADAAVLHQSLANQTIDRIGLQSLSCTGTTCAWTPSTGPDFGLPAVELRGLQYCAFQHSALGPPLLACIATTGQSLGQSFLVTTPGRIVAQWTLTPGTNAFAFGGRRTQGLLVAAQGNEGTVITAIDDDGTLHATTLTDPEARVSGSNELAIEGSRGPTGETAELFVGHGENRLAHLRVNLGSGAIETRESLDVTVP